MAFCTERQHGGQLSLEFAGALNRILLEWSNVGFRLWIVLCQLIEVLGFRLRGPHRFFQGSTLFLQCFIER